MYHSFPLAGLLPLVNCKSPFVFLDTACPDQENRYSYLFSAPIRVLTAKSPAQVPALWRAIDDASKNAWVAGYLSYEAAFGLEERLQKISFPLFGGPRCLGWFGVFAKPYIYDHVRGMWDRPLPRFSGKEKPVSSNDHSAITLDHGLGESVYKDKIGTIKRYIARGSAYQINFTYDVSLTTSLDAFSLYRRLRENQKAPFCSFISTGGFQALSFSPELFFNKRKRRIYVKPMKGTATRGRFPEEDHIIGQVLSLDAKNRAENVMIVDLMRSDLGKICSIGSVKTTKLFKVEKYRTVHQMTSTVQGTLRPPMTSGSVLKNLFPSGSVTGAPKIKSMEIIHGLESGERGIYCGAIGFIDPFGSAVFSVPIRTLQSTSRRGHWKYRVGSGIVWDSKPSAEWRECAAKCRFLTEAPPSFELFESILYNARLVYKKDHARRLKNSARYFGYSFDEPRIFSMLAHIEKKLKGFSKQKV
jgi:para-aminobenzoate synthetase / 4-amino-4-deoxychorismate lyase